MGPSTAESVTARRMSFATLAGAALGGVRRGSNNMTRSTQVMVDPRTLCAPFIPNKLDGRASDLMSPPTGSLAGHGNTSGMTERRASSRTVVTCGSFLREQIRRRHRRKRSWWSIWRTTGSVRIAGT